MRPELIVRCANREEYVTLLAMVFAMDELFFYNAQGSGVFGSRDPERIYRLRAGEYPWLVIYGPGHLSRRDEPFGVVTGHKDAAEFNSIAFSNLTLGKLCEFLGFHKDPGPKEGSVKREAPKREPGQGNRFSMIKARRARA